MKRLSRKSETTDKSRHNINQNIMSPHEPKYQAITCAGIPNHNMSWSSHSCSWDNDNMASYWLNNLFAIFH